MRAILDTCRVVFVGDVDQLPPVGPGAPLTELIRSQTVPVVRLREIYRQGAGSTIIDVAHGIQRGESPSVTPPGTTIQDFYFIHREDPAAILATIEELVTRRIPRRFGFEPREHIQVLSPMRLGLLGVQHLNERLQFLINPTGTGLKVGERVYRVGDRVMQIRNDYDRGVFNGDTGTVERVDAANARLVVQIDGKPVIYERSHLDKLVLAYAVSVHKSQGSEYTVVVMPVTTQHFKMLQRNLLYTGLTRGKELVVLVGTPKAVGLAVRNQEQSLRNTLLASRLQSLAPTSTPRSIGDDR
jgi:exodeoxyribonuclease V alpha subunit